MTVDYRIDINREPIFTPIPISRDEAKKMIEEFFQAYPELRHPQPDRPLPVDYQDLWFTLYERVLGQWKEVARLMEEMDPSLLEDD